MSLERRLEYYIGPRRTFPMTALLEGMRQPPMTMVETKTRYVLKQTLFGLVVEEAPQFFELNIL